MPQYVCRLLCMVLALHRSAAVWATSSRAGHDLLQLGHVSTAGPVVHALFCLQDGGDSNGALVPQQQQNGNLPAVPSTGPSTVPVQFVVPEYLTHWGQVLKVVGSLEELGNWKVEKVSRVGVCRWW